MSSEVQSPKMTTLVIETQAIFKSFLTGFHNYDDDDDVLLTYNEGWFLT